MNQGNLHSDAAAEQLWKRCPRDRDLRWLLESVLCSRIPSIGRTLLLSPIELFGEAQKRVGRKLWIKFRLMGLPYITGNFNRMYKSLNRRRCARAFAPDQSQEAHVAISEWQAANSRRAQDLTVAAILETVRRNSSLRDLTAGEEPITAPRVAQAVPNPEKLDWQPLKGLVELFEPFLMRSSSRKPINRFTLNFTALLPHLQPEISVERVAIQSAHHFARLLKARKVSEDAWRQLLLRLIDLDFVTASTPTFLWCRKFPGDGFVASTSMSWGTSPPSCPWCGKTAHAIAAFVPTGSLRDAMALRDGLLGAAIGWHLIRHGIAFTHGHSEAGTELDFLLEVGDLRLLIECKVLNVLVPAKQLARNVRKGVKQLERHAALMESRGTNLLDSVCVVNLTDRGLSSLMSIGLWKESVISYERFPEWLRAKICT
jgi:hypothetical protein